MRVVKGYRIIDIPVGIGSVLHPLYIKEHNNPQGTNKNRTLFVGNVDYAKDRTHEEIDGYLRKLFSAFGEIESTSVSEFKQHIGEDQGDLSTDAHDDIARNTFMSRYAHLVFCKKGSLKSIIAASDSAFYELTKSVTKTWGIGQECVKKSASELYKAHTFKPFNTAELREEVEEYMKGFDEQEEIERIQRNKRSREPDEDGFVVVKQRSKKKRVEEKRGSGAPRERVKKNEKELSNFYKFQIREEKQKKLFDLRRRFDEDKEKVAQMKAGRKFKPF